MVDGIYVRGAGCRSRGALQLMQETGRRPGWHRAANARASSRFARVRQESPLGGATVFDADSPWPRASTTGRVPLPWRKRWYRLRLKAVPQLQAATVGPQKPRVDRRRARPSPALGGPCFRRRYVMSCLSQWRRLDCAPGFPWLADAVIATAADASSRAMAALVEHQAPTRPPDRPG